MKVLVIVGHWNSGSTHLIETLARHREAHIGAAGRLPNCEERHTRRLLKRILRRRGQRPVDEWCYYNNPILTESEMTWFRRHWLARLDSRDGGAGFTVVKNPWLLFCPDLLRRALAGVDAHYCYIGRHGCNQVVSWSSWFDEAQDLLEIERNLLARADLWKQSVAMMRRNWFGQPDFTAIRYEDLCRQPRRSMEFLCRCAGVDPDGLPSNWEAGRPPRDDKWQRIPRYYQRRIAAVTGPEQAWLDAQVPETTVAPAAASGMEDAPTGSILGVGRKRLLRLAGAGTAAALAGVEAIGG